MAESFVMLDIVTSDLAKTKAPDKGMDPMGFFFGRSVLLGGPGAGKSTMVKWRVMQELDTRRRSLPVFLRLRTYVGCASIEARLSIDLKRAGFRNPEAKLQEMLQQPCLCVLDGLDEVKPMHRAKVVDDINAFYHRYYSNQRHGNLIVTCRREAYLDTPLDLPHLLEVRPLRDAQIRELADKWPLGYPRDKTAATFWRDLTSLPRIHELARSPLLLVGGLMQYTESNTGVPDERYKYLERVASWLICDWARTQGHPADHNVQLYDRILPKLAFHMHSRSMTDIAIDEAETLVGAMLPTYGVPAERSAEVIANLRTRTGIIVGDDKHHLVFAQFGLQEYFASLEIGSAVGHEEVGKLRPLHWWREPVLLAVAQQRDPAAYLEALNRVDPILATAAVAECPTPSVPDQSRAVTVCVREVDALNEAIKTPVIQLLRKVEGAIEQELVNCLEQRLLVKSKVAQFVGLIFATAGTAAANEALLRHPNVWALCLADAGYLSDSFEGLLYKWVEGGDARECFHAADALLENVQTRNLSHLIAYVPKLSPEKADYVARKVLESMLDSRFLRRFGDGLPPGFVDMAVRCVPYVRRADRFVARQVFDRKQLGDPSYRRTARRRGNALTHVATIMRLAAGVRSSEPARIADAVRRWISRAREYQYGFPLTLGVGGAGLAGVGLATGCRAAEVLCAGLAFSFIIIATSHPVPQMPWEESSQPRSVTYGSATLFSLCCISLFSIIAFPQLHRALQVTAPSLLTAFGLLLAERDSERHGRGSYTVGLLDPKRRLHHSGGEFFIHDGSEGLIRVLVLFCPGAVLCMVFSFPVLADAWSAGVYAAFSVMMALLSVGVLFVGSRAQGRMEMAASEAGLLIRNAIRGMAAMGRDASTCDD